MNRNELAWVVIRALGVISLWFLALAIIGLLLYIPAIVLSSYTMPLDPQRAFQRQMDIWTHLLRIALEITFYGFLSRYLLRKGKFAHSLICGHIPDA